MKIKVSEIPDEGLDIDGEETIEPDGQLPVRKASIKLRVTKSGRDVLMAGDVSALVDLTCGRCLREFRSDVSVHVDLAYCPQEDVSGEEAHELAPDEMETGFYVDDEIDIGEMAREQLILNLPMKPLCREACKGICPKCGADLNEVKCGCDMSRVDERFKILESLRKKGKE